MLLCLWILHNSLSTVPRTTVHQVPSRHGGVHAAILVFILCVYGVVLHMLDMLDLTWGWRWWLGWWASLWVIMILLWGCALRIFECDNSEQSRNVLPTWFTPAPGHWRLWLERCSVHDTLILIKKCLRVVKLLLQQLQLIDHTVKRENVGSDWWRDRIITTIGEGGLPKLGPYCAEHLSHLAILVKGLKSVEHSPTCLWPRYPYIKRSKQSRDKM